MKWTNDGICGSWHLEAARNTTTKSWSPEKEGCVCVCVSCMREGIDQYQGDRQTSDMFRAMCFASIRHVAGLCVHHLVISNVPIPTPFMWGFHVFFLGIGYP